MTQTPPTAAHALTITAVPYDSPAAHALVRALQREQLALYGRADDPGATAAAEFAPPHGLFLLATGQDAIAVACGGWRTAGAATAEVKRMYVTSPARGRGYGRRMLEALEQDAREHGMSEVILETGIKNHAALALYTRCGYGLIEPYVAGRDPLINRALSKTLRPPQRAEPPSQLSGTGQNSEVNALKDPQDLR
ncbi:GNAT family N-acetyltransferase [Streptacidiphilus sp. EB103A]|uniref:GNAT family N-acetyltransferase n=1 Tax=Streptacidiphilus sp. EB103A TaxID=3156275 RepID=UPI003518C373